MGKDSEKMTRQTWVAHWVDSAGALQSREITGTIEHVREACADLPDGRTWVRLTGAGNPHKMGTSSNETE